MENELDFKDDEPDFKNPASVIRWHGRQTIELLSLMKREKAAARLRALNSAVDVWTKIYRLFSDTQELQNLKAEMEELRQLINESVEKRDGPMGVIRG